ncbi:DNA polymerase III subunit delta [Croceitalea rosinachiae]|uniref:DNA polymerase III subunit delta n=1 Tax=Croceitalea rosinachiae TaxID=3075596 RepID=A0ABU3ACT5_9FLAO|nr:DNA polymerase III subunit delta [Croceitalea sp. F388]MDT0607695.1 DNA polymerase III subunit delta [Croceitalea sp. F388]
MEEAKRILNDIKNGSLNPIYFLMGEEPFYIDVISDYISKKVLTEVERGFNQMVLYGKDTSVEEIVSNAKRYPMMAEHQVIIVKEAQHLSRAIEQLVAYAENPQTTTILVICYKYKKLDKRKAVYKVLSKNGIVFESKKLYENQVADWIKRFINGKGYQITPKSAALLVEFLGTDLSKISNELGKLFLVVDKQTEITSIHIEKYIGISKDFNNFELKKAVGERDIKKATRIINYFAQNPKDNPFVVTVTLLHSFFTQLLQYHGMNDHSPKAIAQVLRVSPYFVEEYQTAAKNYPMKKVSKIVSNLRKLDLKGKGVGSQNISQHDLLKELLATLF